MKLGAELNRDGNIDVCDLGTGEVVAIFKGCYYDEGKRIINKWIKENGYVYSGVEYGRDRLTIWVK